jgi:uncharacterized membrane protein
VVTPRARRRRGHGLGIGVPALDEVLQQPGGEHPLTLVFGGGQTAARDVLAAIAGSLISVTGLTFSFTVVALQLSSSQHLPRFLQTFVTDRVVQTTLALLVGTFVYALTVLRTVRTGESKDAIFVPRLSVTVGLGLTVASVVGLVLFLGHLARSLRVETMLRDVSEEARNTFARELRHGQDDASRAVVLPSGDTTSLCAHRSGFVTDVDVDRIFAAARAAGGDRAPRARIGDSVVAGTPLPHTTPTGSEVAGEPAGIEQALNEGVRLGYERRPDRDLAYSLRKVVDIAVRAVSPGLNDPTTAVHALSHVSALLGELVAHSPPSRLVRDEAGCLRLVLPQWTAPALVQLGLEEPVQFADGQPAVLCRLARLLQELAWRAHGARSTDRCASTSSTSSDVRSTAPRSTRPRQRDGGWTSPPPSWAAGPTTPERPSSSAVSRVGRDGAARVGVGRHGRCTAAGCSRLPAALDRGCDTFVSFPLQVLGPSPACVQ